MELPAELERTFWGELRSFEEDRAMPYITSVERLGIEKGIEKGSRQALVRILEARFGTLSPGLAERIHAVTESAALERLITEAALAPSLEAFVRALP